MSGGSRAPRDDGADPERIARLRSPERLASLDPARIWDVLEPIATGTIVDVGAGVGYLALPFARAFPDAEVVACDVVPGMLDELRAAAVAEGLRNLRCLLTYDREIGLPASCADLLAMCQVHHELADAPSLLAECRRVLRPGAPIAIIDWKHDADGGGRRVPEEVIRRQLADAGFGRIASHALYERHAFVTAVA